MSGFGSSSFGGGFGQTGNQQPTAFGGFGANTNTNSGFGASANPNAFGASATTGGGLFGNTAPAGSGGGGFGTTSGSFGANTPGGFGVAKPAFGSSSTTTGGAGLFGSSTTNIGSSGFSGFGSTPTTNSTSTPFGGTSGGGLFGASKPAFGTTGAASGNSLFGSNTSTGFGANTGGFGAANNPGIGANVGDPPGTAITPFQAHQEKEPNSTSNQSNSFQSILFQDPYKKWSSEELRLADYSQGRRHGNANGSGGAFGVSSGFGGTGFNTSSNQQSSFSTPSTGSNMFGGNATTTSSFGGQSAGGAFGGGLFGSQPKPAATGGLFGGASQPAQSGGLFANTSSGGAFGGSGTTGGTFGTGNPNTGGGLFGSNANPTQNKPSGFSFGGSGTTNTGFGAPTTSNAFGPANTNTSSTGGSLFGGASQPSTGGLFGGNQQQQQQQGASTGFGSSFGGQNQQPGSSLFGNQPKPSGGLFGASNTSTTGGGLFSNTNSSNQFGGAGTNAASGGLFGPKPANSGGGLFATGNMGQTAGNGGMFGNLGSNNQAQQAGQGSLFTSLGQNQQKPSMFGTSQPAAGGMFGNQNNQPQNSLFSNSAAHQQPQNSILGGSILGNPQGINSTPQSLTANITDVSAYGTPSLFSNLGGAEASNPGPLATPLSSKTKSRRSSILPMYKLNPASASRFVTPQKRGFGFSYSTYGTPGSPSSVSSTPGGMGRSLLGSSLSRGLSKSVSTSSLRRSFNTEDSILAPGAFSASSGPRYSTNSGSVKKLIINKDMRSDLFSTPTKEKQQPEQSNGSRKLSKRVSFDTSTMDSIEGAESDSTTEPKTTDANSQQELSSSRPANRGSNGLSGVKTATNGSGSEVDQNKGKELAIVHEEDISSQNFDVSRDNLDKEPGSYYMKPSKDEISAMNRMQRQKVANFVVGRDNVGFVAFKVPVDLSNIDLDELFGSIVVLETRSATVYPVSAKKPPVGKGLNVPAMISLEQSWPRGRDKRPSTDARRFNKHVERLKRIENTSFVNYDQNTGVWDFSVEHFTTYGLEYDDEDTDAELLKEATSVDNQPSFDSIHTGSQDSLASPEDDTFDFRRKRRALPGAFDHRDEDFGEKIGPVSQVQSSQSFLGNSFVGSTSNALVLSTEVEPFAERDDEYDVSESEDAAGSLLGQHLATEHPSESPDGDYGTQLHETPGGILRARMRAVRGSAAPMRLQVPEGDEWMNMLQKSVSPQKRDRAFLRSINESAAYPADQDGESLSRNRAVSDGRGFATSIDLMNSLFDKAKPTPVNTIRAAAPSRGFVQWPYLRQIKTFGSDKSTMDQADRAFYTSMRPSWGPDGTLVFATTPRSLDQSLDPDKASILFVKKSALQGEHREIRMAKFSNEASAKSLQQQIRMTHIDLLNGVPTPSLQATTLKTMFHGQDANNPASVHEKLVWELASILFDDLNLQDPGAEQWARRANLSHFWSELVDSATLRSIGLAKTSEEKAVASLSGHRIQEACKHLLEGRNFRLATLVSLIGTSDQSKKDMREQLGEWQDADFLSEFVDPIRAIYELLSGNVCVCEGKKGVPVENRMESFIISKRFGLDWKQSFGLRLWYSISQKDNISAAVERFEEDVGQDREVKPHTWYVEQGISALWEDPYQDLREDLLWGLLRLHSNPQADLESILRPENSQLSPLDSRLSWQLGRALLTTGKVSYGQHSAEKSDAATLSYAAQLVNEGSWLEATFVLLHLGQPSTRVKSLREHLSRHAGLIGQESGKTFSTLTQTLKIPPSWIWEAQALYMRSVLKDPKAEVQCLLRAGSFADAHETLVGEVAPCAIIERDYSSLANILSRFDGHEDSIPGWMLGGDVYKAFLSLYDHYVRGEQAPQSVIEKLLAGLPAMRESAETSSVMRIAAVSEMGAVVAKVIVQMAQQDQKELPRVLGLPLTEDAHLRYSLNFSMAYYEGVMAGAR